jgi:ABC-type transporter Mla MlaB component
MKKFEIKTSRKGNNVSLSLTGNLTLENISAIYDDLKKINLSSEKLTVKISEVESIDLTMLQLLYSMKKQHGTGKLVLETEVPDDLKILLDKTGFTDLTNLKN